MRVLYVEDNRVNLMLVERVAKMGGHEVINRTSGEAALADFAEIAPDLVLMDIQLEGAMTGLEAVQKLREQGYTVPVVALTAYAMKGDREKALRAGCEEYLPKPLPINKLVELLHRYERQAKRNAATQATEAETQEVRETQHAPSDLAQSEK